MVNKHIGVCVYFIGTEWGHWVSKLQHVSMDNYY